MTSAFKKIYIGNGKGGKISDYQISLSNPRNLWILQLQDAWNRGNHSPSAATKGSSLSGRLLRSRNLDPTTRQFDDSTIRQPHFIVKTQAIQQEAKPEFNKAAGKNKTQSIQPRNFQVFRLPKVHGLGKKNGNSFHILILWMEETLHHAVEVGSLSQDLQGFMHPRWENSPDVFHPQRPPNCSPPGSPNFRVSRARQRWLCLLRPHPMPEIGDAESNRTSVHLIYLVWWKVLRFEKFHACLKNVCKNVCAGGFFFNMQQNRIHNGGFTVHIWRKLHTFIGSWKAVGTVCAFSPLARPLATPRVVSQIDCKEPGATNRGWGRIWPRKPREHRTFSTLEATIQIIKWTSTFWYFLGFDSIEKNFCPTLFLGIHLIIEKKTTGKNPSLAAQLVADFSIHAGIITKNSFNPSEKY